MELGLHKAIDLARNTQRSWDGLEDACLGIDQASDQR